MEQSVKVRKSARKGQLSGTPDNRAGSSDSGLSARLLGNAANRNLAAQSAGLNSQASASPAVQLIAREPVVQRAPVIQMMSEREWVQLRILIAEYLQRAGLPAGPDDVQRVINAVAPAQTLMQVSPLGGPPNPDTLRLAPTPPRPEPDFEMTWLRAQILIDRYAQIHVPRQQAGGANGGGRPPQPQPQPQPAQPPAPAIMTEEQRRAARVARFGDGAARIREEERQREATGRAMGDAAADAQINYVGNRWNAHLTDHGGDSEARITWNQAVNIIRNTVPEALGDDRFGVPSYSIEYRNQPRLTIVYSSPDSGQTINVFHIGPGG